MSVVIPCCRDLGTIFACHMLPYKCLCTGFMRNCMGTPCSERIKYSQPSRRRRGTFRASLSFSASPVSVTAAICASASCCDPPESSLRLRRGQSWADILEGWLYHGQVAGGLMKRQHAILIPSNLKNQLPAVIVISLKGQHAD